MLDDLLEHRVGVELGREEAARARELLRERTRASLRLVELAAPEGAARRLRELSGQLEVVVREAAFLPEEHEHDAAAAVLVRLERNGEQRIRPRLAGELLPLRVEARVFGDRRGGDDATLRPADVQDGGRAGHALGQRLRQARRQLERACELELGTPPRHQHCGRAAAQRLRRGLCRCVERLREGERLAEHGCDAREASLHARLTRALLVQLGVAKRDRRERREGADPLEVALVERPLAARARAEHSPRLAGPADRCDDRTREVVVRRMRERRGERGVVRRDHRLAEPNGLAGEPEVVGELDAHEVGRQPVDRGAAQRLPSRVVQVDVGRPDTEERSELVDETLEHRIELELGRDVLGGAEEAPLDAQLLVVLREEPRDVQRDARLPRDRLGDGDVRSRPAGHRGSVQREHAERLVEDPDRRRQHSAAADLAERVDGAERGVADRDVRFDVAHRDRPLLPQREVRDRQPLRVPADRLDLGRVPFERDRRPVVGIAESDERALRAKCPRGLLDRDAHHGVEVELRPELGRDPADHALTLERVGERGRRAKPIERECRLVGERLEEREVVAREHPAGRRAGDGEHGEHASLRHERDERRALRTDALDEPPVDERRGIGVEHRERQSAEDRARSPGRLVAKVDVRLAEPFDVVALHARDDAHGPVELLPDDDEAAVLDAQELRGLVDEGAPDGLGAVGTDERGRELGHRGQLAVELGRPRLGLSHPVLAADEAAVTRDAHEEEQGRHERGQEHGERRPEMTVDRRPPYGDENAEHRGQHRQARKDRRESDVGGGRRGAVAPDRRDDQDRERAVHERDREERRRVEEQRFRLD